jgi:methyl-accepting chemotaxis protein
MNWFFNRSLLQKFSIIFSAIILVVLVTGGITAYSSKEISDNVYDIYEKNLVPISVLSEIRKTLNTKRVLARDLVLAQDSSAIEGYAAEIRGLHRVTDSLIAVYRPLISSDEEAALFQRFLTSVKAYRASRDEIIRLSLEGRRDEARSALYGIGETTATTVFSDLVKLIESNRSQAQHFTNDIVRRGRTITFYALLNAALCSVVAFAGVWLLRRSVGKPIVSLTEKASAVAGGKLDTWITSTSNDEIGVLARAIGTMVGNIRAALTNLEQEKQTVERKIAAAVESSEAERQFLKKSFDMMLESVNAFSAGDLTQHLSIEHDDTITSDEEMEGLISGYNAAVANIRTMVEQVSEAVDATASASAEIAASTEQMSAGIQEQAEQTSRIAGAIQHMATSSAENTHKALTSAEQALEASNDARLGGEVIAQTIDGIGRLAAVVTNSAQSIQTLGESSEQIGEVVRVIAEIADQTNLLALNAAIEAARAGEQGRGFAVVADEVRKLAERTQQATKEIASIISVIQRGTDSAVKAINAGTEEVERGKESAARAAEALKNIINRTSSVSNEINTLAHVSEEQAESSKNIAQTIRAVQTVANESSRSTNEISRTIDDMNKLTLTLQSLVGRFVITGSNRPRSASALSSGSAGSGTNAKALKE